MKDLTEQEIINFELIIYMLTKNASRNSFIEFLEIECGLSEDDWREFKKYVTDKTGLRFKYL